MAPIEILQDLFFIERGFLNANHFVYRSKTPILIDTAYSAGLEETLGVIRKLDLEPSAVGLIISTHCHCDHIGGNRHIQDISGCDIALHEIGKYFIETRDAWSTWWRYYDQEAEFFRCTTALHHGGRVSVGPHEFQVIHTPGHAADGIVLYHAQQKLLISSDTLWEKDMAVMTVRVEGSAALFHMLESLDKIAALDVRVAYPGHGRPFADVPAAIVRSRQRLKAFLADGRLIGMDVLKKIIIYTLLMHGTLAAEGFLARLMNSRWFKETVDLYFDGAYETTFIEIMQNFIKRGIVCQKDGLLFTMIKP